MPASASGSMSQQLSALVAGRTPDAPPLAGAAIARIDGKGHLQAIAAGGAELAPDGAILQPLTPDSPVRIASISKLVVALVALRLMEQGRLDLDRDVRAYGLDLRNPLTPDAPLTLRMLLSHRSGLSDGERFTVPLGGTTLDILTQPGGARFTASPGLRFEYANANFGLAAAAIEGATGQRFDRLAHDLVLAPLRLDAGFNWQDVSTAGKGRGAALYQRKDGRWEVAVDAAAMRPADDCPVGSLPRGTACDLSAYRPGTNGFLFSPQGGLRISVADLARLGAALLRPRLSRQTPGPRALLTAPALDQLYRTTPTAAGMGASGDYAALMQSYGLAFQCMSGSGKTGTDQPLAPRLTRWCGHLGEAYGLTSGLWIDRDARKVYAYAVTGVGGDPAAWPGRNSRFQRWEEALLRLLATAP